MSSSPVSMLARTDVRRLAGWRVPGHGEVLQDCSLIVATYNRAHELARLLESLLQIPDPPGEVVVVDGCATPATSDGLRDWVKSHRPCFDFCYVESPAGLTRQRNVGVDLSTRPYLFYLDDDAVPLPGYFAEMRRVFCEDRHKRVGGLAGSVINEMDKPIPRRWRLRFALHLVPRIQPMIYYPSGTNAPSGLMKPFSGVRQVDVMPGCAWTFRREVFETDRFSGFFEGYSLGEDLEMSLRVGHRWEILCCGDARILHLPAASGRPVSYSRGVMEMRNRYFVWKRHSPHPGARMVSKFWLETVFLITMDLVWFCARPWRFEPVGHLCGTLCEAARCLFSPVHYEEPPARREYMLDPGQAELGKDL